MTLTNVLTGTSVKDLLRAANSDKEYLSFDISVFNVGAVIRVKCTDNYKEINPQTWNGYDFTTSNCENTKHCIAARLVDYVNECNDDDDKEIPARLARRIDDAINTYLVR
jgi:hypothetical protein